MNTSKAWISPPGVCNRGRAQVLHLPIELLQSNNCLNQQREYGARPFYCDLIFLSAVICSALLLGTSDSTTRYVSCRAHRQGHVCQNAGHGPCACISAAGDRRQRIHATRSRAVSSLEPQLALPELQHYLLSSQWMAQGSVCSVKQRTKECHAFACALHSHESSFASSILC